MSRLAAVCAAALAVSLALAALLSPGCAEYRVRTDFDSTFDFAPCRTYDWLLPPAEKRLDPRVAAIFSDGVFRRAIASELTARSLVRVVGGKPDLLVDWDMNLSDEGRVRAPGTDQDMDGRGSVWYEGNESDSLRDFEYVMATLTIDLLDPATRRRLWRATAETQVHGDTDSSTRYRRLADAIRHVLAEFPPEK